MTNSRALIARFALPLAAAALVLTACGSAGSSDEAAPAAATSAAAESMESEPMESMESEPMESTDAEPMESMESDDMASTDAEPAAAAAGAYITLAQYEGSKDMYAASDVVLFFAADWCPTCQEATANLEADPAAIPAGLAIVRVDYDDSDDLKQKYGVTVQHTFVQVDADGNEVAKWSGSVTADQIAKQTA
jgi:thiol-disulfide isomerase/thioredoxin